MSPRGQGIYAYCISPCSCERREYHVCIYRQLPLWPTHPDRHPSGSRLSCPRKLTGEHPERLGPPEGRVNLWPLLYYRDPAFSFLWRFIRSETDAEGRRKLDLLFLPILRPLTRTVESPEALARPRAFGRSASLFHAPCAKRRLSGTVNLNGG
jgi:hypothetical protein